MTTLLTTTDIQIQIINYRHTDCGEAGSAGSRVTESEDHAMSQWEKINKAVYTASLVADWWAGAENLKKVL